MATIQEIRRKALIIGISDYDKLETFIVLDKRWSGDIYDHSWDLFSSGLTWLPLSLKLASPSQVHGNQNYYSNDLLCYVMLCGRHK